MKALLMRDLYISGRNYALLISIFLILCTVLVIATDEPFRYIRIASLFALIVFGNIVFSTEKEKKTNRYLVESILPIRKKDIVNEKYLLSAVFSLVVLAVVFGALITMNDVIHSHLDDAKELINISFLICSMVFVVTMVDLLAYDTGSRIGMTFCGIVIILIILGVTHSLFDNLLPASSDSQEIWNSIKIGGIVFTISLIGTYIISRIRIKKREYL